MKLQDVYHYFQSPPPVYLRKEVAVCYILAILIDNGESYGTALIQHIKDEHPPYRLSDTVLYSALEFLTDEGMIQSYMAKCTHYRQTETDVFGQTRIS